MATQILADLGASVIKVERPGTGDETRAYEPRVGEESAYFFAFNRGKKSITLDLRSETGQRDAKRLAETADVVVENFLPGTMDRFGLGYEDVRARNDQVVYVSASGFGQTGPERDRKGYDTVFQALSGVMSLTGEPDRGPAKAGVPIADLTSGLWVAIGVLSGLAGRASQGHGSYVDIAMMDVQVSLLALAAARLFALDEDPARTGTEHPGRVPSAAFECQDGWLHITGTDLHWGPLCDALGLVELGGDPELKTNAGRLADRARVMEALRNALRTRPRAEVVEVLTSVGVPVGEVRTVREALSSEQVAARDMVGHFDHPSVGRFPALRTPIRFSGFDDPEFTAPPQLGADNAELLEHVEAPTEAKEGRR